MKHVLCTACLLCPLFGILYYFATKSKDERQAKNCLKISLYTLAVGFLTGLLIGGMDVLKGTIWLCLIVVGGIKLIDCIVDSWREVC